MKDVKILYGLAAARCAFPKCRKVCAKEATEKDNAIALGRIAHIYAHSDDGPRGNPDLTNAERDSYDNWILLCADCHDIVDKQADSYTADKLKVLKTEHEEWVTDRLEEQTLEITFHELEMVTQALLSDSNDTSFDFTLIAPAEKIRKNELSQKAISRLKIGLMKTKETEDFLNDIEKRISGFSNRLSRGFKDQYDDLKSEGLNGDEIFESLFDFATNGSPDFDRQTAGLSVLSYLFEKCEVFEK